MMTIATPRRLKVLISAYACSPFRGSEPGVGWGFVKALARHHDLWVISEKNEFESDIESALAAMPDLRDSVTFHYVPRLRPNAMLKRVWPPSYYWSYRRWHQDVAEVARRLHADHGFDLAHQLTMVGFREPGYMWKLGVPFVWGPVGGMGSFPWRFLHKVGVAGAAYYAAYNAMNAVQVRCLRRPKLAARVAGEGLICATEENARQALRRWGCRSTVLCEVGLPEAAATAPLTRSESEPMRIVWSGVHTARKALNIGLEALARVERGLPWSLDVLGSGPRTESWKSLASRLGIAERCRFHGQLKRDAALAVMSRAHVMLITSLRDLTSTVTVEALASGLPVVCLDHCGFAHVVDETCGVRVPLAAPSETVESLAKALEGLGCEARRQRLSVGAIERARRYSWTEKAEVVSGIYRKVVRQSAA